MKARSKTVVAGLFSVVLTINAGASVPSGDKRVIFTSGDKVHQVHYQLGQSTVLYLGLKPETIICGNKNYFNVEKLKEGLTVQPLANISTNLTVMAQGRRYLFFLNPAKGKSDGFVEVKWVSPEQARSVKTTVKSPNEIVRELGQKTKVGSGIEFSILRERTVDKGNRRIFEIELKNLTSQILSVSLIEVIASLGGVPLSRQVLVWESDDLKSKGKLMGRVIVSGHGEKPLSLIVGFKGKSIKFIVKGTRD